jgi:hypothetical protein
MFTLPDGSSHAGPLHAVILDWRMTHELYEGIYDPQKPSAPICFANSATFSELKPSHRAPKPKAESCNACPMNVFGSAPTGRGKACKNMRKLAIVPPNATPETEPMILMVSPTGLKNFDNYVNSVASGEDGVMPIQITTLIGFNAKEAYPTLVFAPGPLLSDEQLGVMFKLKSKTQLSLDREPEIKQ